MGYSFRLQWSDEDGGYIATCPEFPGLSAYGATADEAIQEAQMALKSMIKSYEGTGEPLPPPKKKQTYSGQFRVRISKSLHRRASEMAEEENVSLNSFIAQAIFDQPNSLTVDAAKVNPRKKPATKAARTGKK